MNHLHYTKRNGNECLTIKLYLEINRFNSNCCIFMPSEHHMAYKIV